MKKILTILAVSSGVMACGTGTANKAQTTSPTQDVPAANAATVDSNYKCDFNYSNISTGERKSGSFAWTSSTGDHYVELEGVDIRPYCSNDSAGLFCDLTPKLGSTVASGRTSLKAGSLMITHSDHDSAQKFSYMLSCSWN